MESPIKRRLSEFFTKETASRAGLIELYGGGIDPLIASLEYDSRKAGPQTLFFALPGLHTDGHKYIEEAISKGACTIVHEAEISKKKRNCVYKGRKFAFCHVPNRGGLLRLAFKQASCGRRYRHRGQKHLRLPYLAAIAAGREKSRLLLHSPVL
jgi:hypothetical protein